MRKPERNHRIDSVFLLLLFALFAGCILMVLLLGAASYEKTVEKGNQAYNSRTGIQYIATKIRHADEAEAVFVGSYFDRLAESPQDIPTLYLRMGEADDGYYTKIYYYDGYLRELLCSENANLLPQAGSEILPAQGFFLTVEEDLIRAEIIDEDGNATQMYLHIRSDREAGR